MQSTRQLLRLPCIVCCCGMGGAAPLLSQVEHCRVWSGLKFGLVPVALSMGALLQGRSIVHSFTVQLQVWEFGICGRSECL